MKLYLPITVDLYNIYPLRVLNLQQNNVGRGALITLTAAGAVIVPDSESLYVYAQKQDGTVVYNTCTLKDNQIQVDFDEQMTIESGILQVELQMVDTSGNSITTPIFQINVQKSNIDYQKITSQDSFQALVTTLTEVQELKKNGLKGDPGEAATLQIGTVTASEPGSDPAVTNSGTEQNAILNFVLPRGEQGPIGPPISTVDPSTATEDDSGKAADAYQTKLALDEQNVKMTAVKIYRIGGMIFNSSESAIKGTGCASVFIINNSIAEIHFSVKITSGAASGEGEIFSYGLNRDIFSNLDPSIPQITPINGGSLIIYDAYGTPSSEINGYGAFMEGDMQFWLPSRVYDTSGSAGIWPASTFSVGQFITGVCYGTVTG